MTAWSWTALPCPAEQLHQRTGRVLSRINSGEPTDGKVTLIGYDHTNSSSKQRWWTGIAGTYVYADDLSNGLLAPDGEKIRNSPTLTLTSVPEPGSLSLVALGLGSFLLLRRRG